MNEDPRIRRLQFRAWHRGIKEADLAVGGFFDRYHAEWGVEEIDWFERFIEEQDADIMAWALGTLPLPDGYIFRSELLPGVVLPGSIVTPMDMIARRGYHFVIFFIFFFL